MTKTIDDETYTKIDDETYTDSNGGEWVAFEIADVKDKIRWAGQEMAKLAKGDLTEYDTAAAYTEALEIQAQSEEDLRIMELLFS